MNVKMEINGQTISFCALLVPAQLANGNGLERAKKKKLFISVGIIGLTLLNTLWITEIDG